MIELLEDRVAREEASVKEVSTPEIVAMKQYEGRDKAKYAGAEDNVVYSCDAVCKNCHCATFV